MYYRYNSNNDSILGIYTTISWRGRWGKSDCPRAITDRRPTSRPYEYLVVVVGVADKDGQDNSSLIPANGGHLMDAAGVEEVEVADP